MCLPFGVSALAAVESRSSSSGSTPARSATMTADDRALHLLLKKIEAIQQEVSELRGRIELQEHEIQQLRKNDPAAAVVPLPVVVPLPAPVLVPAEKTLETPADLHSSANTNHDISTDKAHYEKAFEFIGHQHYDEALAGFQSYLTSFPAGEQVANANYWMGEIYFLQWQANKDKVGFLDQATQSFLNITSHHDKHAKATDALFKLGLIEIEKNNTLAARKYLTELRQRYPSSTAARMAEAQLKKLN
jgi:tol-pal system protein YbgF